MGQDNESRSHRAPLTTVDLRHNKLKGSIVLGNYDVSILITSANFLKIIN